MTKYKSDGEIEKRLFEKELQNIQDYGYGIKSFILSMIESASELTNEQITAGDIKQILEWGKEMLKAPVELLEDVHETVHALSKTWDLMVITKGDLFDQESKIKRSGLAKCFKYVEVVSEKSSDTYKSILEKYKIQPSRFLMIGNSFKSDILPALAIGGQALYIEYASTWAHEFVHQSEVKGKEFFKLKNIGELPEFLGKLETYDKS